MAETARQPQFHLGHRPALDGLRGIAVLFVVGVHVTTILMPELGWFPGGFVGVDIFFVLSGFLITSLLLEEHQRNGRISLRSFYKRRAWRLLPALYLIVAIYASIDFLLYPGAHASLKGFVMIVTYWANWYWGPWPQTELGALGHTWSLSIEEQFYVLWAPVLIFVLARRPQWVGRIAASTAVLSLLSGILVWHATHVWTYIYLSTATRLYALMFGALLAAALHNGFRIGRWATPCAVAGSGLLVWMLLTANPINGRLYLWGDAAVAVSSAAVLVACLEPGRPFAVALSLGPLRWVGRISYSLYLWHLFIIEIVYYEWPPTDLLARGLITIAGFMACSVISYYAVEKPILAFSRRHHPPRATGVDDPRNWVIS